MNCSTPDSSVLHCLLEFAQIHVHLSQWSYLTISSSTTPFSFCLRFFPGSRSFPMRWLFALGGQSIEVSATILPVNIQGWFPLGLTGLNPLLSKWLLRVCSSTISSSALSLLYCPTDSQESSPDHSSKTLVLWPSAFFMLQLSHGYTTMGKTRALTIWTFVGNVMSAF